MHFSVIFHYVVHTLSLDAFYKPNSRQITYSIVCSYRQTKLVKKLWQWTDGAV